MEDAESILMDLQKGPECLSVVVALAVVPVR